jgi:hypothetical protein
VLGDKDGVLDQLAGCPILKVFAKGGMLAAYSSKNSWPKGDVRFRAARMEDC